MTDFTPLQEFLDGLCAWRIPGNSLVLYQDGRKVFEAASGFADAEQGIPMTTEHFVNMYSTSKIVTSIAALQLYEQGKFLLYDPLYEYMPEYRHMTVRDAEGNIREAEHEITLHQLMTMTAGFDYDFNTPGFEQARKVTGGHMDTREVFRCVAEDPLFYEPGTRWEYSKGYDLLAAFVEVVSGERFSEYVQKHIFEPMGVEGYFHIPGSLIPKMAEQYVYLEADPAETDPSEVMPSSKRSAVDAQKLPCRSDGTWEKVGRTTVEHILGDRYDSGGAGITSNAENFGKIAAMLSMKGKAPNGERILSEGTVDLMQMNHLTPQQQACYDWLSMTGYSYGLGVRTVVDKAKAGFTGARTEFGWGGAAGSSMIIDSDAHIGCFYAHHMLNPQETYYQMRLRNLMYACLGR